MALSDSLGKLTSVAGSSSDYINQHISWWGCHKNVVDEEWIFVHHSTRAHYKVTEMVRYHIFVGVEATTLITHTIKYLSLNSCTVLAMSSTLTTLCPPLHQTSGSQTVRCNICISLTMKLYNIVGLYGAVSTDLLRPKPLKGDIYRTL